jgi:ferrous iron transport protein A
MLKTSASLCEMIPLDHLPAGEIAEIVTVVGHPEQVHRLNELGVREGTEIAIIQAGSPCIIRLAGQTLCFRSNDLLSVLVRPAAAV